MPDLGVKRSLPIAIARVRCECARWREPAAVEMTIRLVNLRDTEVLGLDLESM